MFLFWLVWSAHVAGMKRNKLALEKLRAYSLMFPLLALTILCGFWPTIASALSPQGKGGEVVAKPTPTSKRATTSRKSRTSAPTKPTGKSKAPENHAIVLAGTYSLYSREETSGAVVGTMKIKAVEGDQISVSGDDWEGLGTTNGKQGYYDWKFTDGRQGRTTFLIKSDGTLEAHVSGPGIDWWYLARPQKKRG